MRPVLVGTTSAVHPVEHRSPGDDRETCRQLGASGETLELGREVDLAWIDGGVSLKNPLRSVLLVENSPLLLAVVPIAGVAADFRAR